MQQITKKEKSYLKSGHAQFKLDNFQEAITYYNEAIKINPVNAETFYKRGNAKLKLRKFKEAINDHSIAINLNPKFAIAYLYRGYAKFQKRDLSGALSDYNMAIKIDPNIDDAFLFRGDLKAELKDFHGAIVDYTSAVSNYSKKEDFKKRYKAQSAINNIKSSMKDLRKSEELEEEQQYTYEKSVYEILRDLVKANNNIIAKYEYSYNYMINDYNIKDCDDYTAYFTFDITTYKDILTDDQYEKLDRALELDLEKYDDRSMYTAQEFNFYENENDGLNILHTRIDDQSLWLDDCGYGHDLSRYYELFNYIIQLYYPSIQLTEENFDNIIHVYTSEYKDQNDKGEIFISINDDHIGSDDLEKLGPPNQNEQFLNQLRDLVANIFDELIDQEPHAISLKYKYDFVFCFTCASKKHYNDEECLKTFGYFLDDKEDEDDEEDEE